MKILFVMLHPGYVRNYESTMRLLVERGHSIHLIFNQASKQTDDRLAERLAEEYPAVTFGPSRKRYDVYRPAAWAIRWAMDYVRYLDPRYENADKLRLRIADKLRDASDRVGGYPMLMLSLLSRVRNRHAVRLILRLLQELERAVPTSRSIDSFLRSFQADVLLVTPLVNATSSQVDYVRSAKALGMRTGLCVASWDNLTNKGLIRVEPDVVIVWNEIQKWEAVELHGIPPSKVVVTGAQRFDEWFERGPSTTREQFCLRAGLEPDQPFFLYLCSSPFIAPDEVPFVKAWIGRIRGHADPQLNRTGILVRPHPQNAAQWQDVDLSEFGNAVIWPRRGAQPVDATSKSDFFDSLYHSAAVVGINTSAMIEAAIVGRPVHTILAPEFVKTQQGTLHFSYLLPEHGGFVRVATDLDEHLGQIATTMRDPSVVRGQIERFVASFVRPNGVDVACTPIVADTIEQLGRMGRARPERMPLHLYPVRYTLALGSFAVLLTDRPRLRKALRDAWRNVEEPARLIYRRRLRKVAKLGSNRLKARLGGPSNGAHNGAAAGEATKLVSQAHEAERSVVPPEAESLPGKS